MGRVRRIVAYIRADRLADCFLDFVVGRDVLESYHRSRRLVGIVAV